MAAWTKRQAGALLPALRRRVQRRPSAASVWWQARCGATTRHHHRPDVILTAFLLLRGVKTPRRRLATQHRIVRGYLVGMDA